MNLSITKQWNSEAINHQPVNISLDWKSGDDFLTVGYSAPFFNDPPSPGGLNGQPFPQLWDYEGTEERPKNYRNLESFYLLKYSYDVATICLPTLTNDSSLVLGLTSPRQISAKRKP